MKIALSLILQIVVLMFGSAASASEQSNLSEAPLPAWVSASLSGGLDKQDSNPALIQAQSYIWCWNYEGQACPGQGSRFRCHWTPTEPGMCFCVDGQTWWCG